MLSNAHAILRRLDFLEAEESVALVDDFWDRHIARPRIMCRIKNPCVRTLQLTDKNWKFVGIIPDFVNESRRRGGYNRGRPRVTYELDHISSIINWVGSELVKRTVNHSIDGLDAKELPDIPAPIPPGLSVFKPLRRDMYSSACRELADLFAEQKVNPTWPVSSARIHDSEKTFLFYSKDTVNESGERVNPLDIRQIITILREKGKHKLACYAMSHVSALAAATNTNLKDLELYGGIIFVKYEVDGGFRRHMDGTSGLGNSPGPVLNVAMGDPDNVSDTESKVLDVMPSLCHDQIRRRSYKYPIRDGKGMIVGRLESPPPVADVEDVFDTESGENSDGEDADRREDVIEAERVPVRVIIKNGESILLWGESRVLWSHCIPTGQKSVRYTMGVRLPENQTQLNMLYTHYSPALDVHYSEYQLDPSFVKEVDISETTYDLKRE